MLYESTGHFTSCKLTEEPFRYSVIAGTCDELHIEPLCLNDILEQSLAGFYGTLSARGIVPSIEMSKERIVRTLDPNALRRIFDNILGNAAKYSDGDFYVKLSSDGAVMLKTARKNWTLYKRRICSIVSSR